MIDQLLPFQDSERVPPTAMQLVMGDPLQETLESAQPVPLGFGLGVIDQAFPSQLSTRVRYPSFAGPVWAPTATQLVGLVHETLMRLL